MTFGSPWMLALLLAGPGAGGRLRARRAAGRARRAAALAAQGLVPTAAPAADAGAAPRAVRTVHRRARPCSSWAWPGPMTTVKTPRREGTVILAVDVSNSMQADDIKPTRIDAAEGGGHRRSWSASRPRCGSGVVAFGDGAVIVQTPDERPTTTC